jgi:SAM-dependent methyltransferase
MVTDVHVARDFYATPRGAMVARLLRERLGTLWPSLPGQSVLGLGYAAPYLRLWREHAQRCIALTPVQLGAARWPAGELPNLSCTGQEDALPFPDLSFDRILLVHGLEAAEHARRLLREVWRVLKDDGHLLVVAPNRRGMWAYVESTPFGQGQPYSAGQIGDLLAAALFRVERRDAALFMPPLDLRPALRSARLWENGARRLLPPGVAGLTITEAVKDMYAALPIAAKAPRHSAFAKAA